MSWFGSAKYPIFDEKVEKATSESIPNGDIDFATALEITDLIRSKQVPAKEAMRGLKKRFMDAENINMQKSSFKLIDFCIKNGGEHFITEISSKEFMDPLIIMLKKDSIDHSLKQYMLENIQVWSVMVSTNPKFEYINQVYKKLQDDGVEFPLIKDFIDSNLIESKVAPEWQDSDACMICSKLFTFLNRKHHCRSCGGVFCNAHSSKTIEVPELGITIPVRVCDNCYDDQKAKRKKHKKSKSKSKSVDININDEDEDLKKAIELSLNATANKNEYIPKSNDRNAMVTQINEDDEDEMMSAAIKASLAELHESPSFEKKIKEEPPKETTTGLYSNLLLDKSEESYSKSTTEVQAYHNNTQPPAQIPPGYHQQIEQQVPIPTYQEKPALKGGDERSVVEFVQLLDKIKSGSSVNNASLLKLKSDLILLHPKITEEINYQNSQIDHYQTLFSKLSVISRLYDDILQTRFNQEQEMLKIQATQRYAPSHVPSYAPSYAPTPVQNQYLSPQETFGYQNPQVFALQQTGANIQQQPNFTMNQQPSYTQSSQNLPPQYLQPQYSSTPQYAQLPYNPQVPQLNQYTGNAPPANITQLKETTVPTDKSVQQQVTAPITQRDAAPIFASLKNLSYAKVTQNTTNGSVKDNTESPKESAAEPTQDSSTPITEKLPEPVKEPVSATPVAPVEEPVKPKEPEIVNLIDL